MGNGDERERAEAAQLWTPAAKLPENVKKMAWYLYLELWKSSPHDGIDLDVEQAVHSRCIQVAERIHKNENPSSEIPT